MEETIIVYFLDWKKHSLPLLIPHGKRDMDASVIATNFLFKAFIYRRHTLRIKKTPTYDDALRVEVMWFPGSQKSCYSWLVFCVGKANQGVTLLILRLIIIIIINNILNKKLFIWPNWLLSEIRQASYGSAFNLLQFSSSVFVTWVSSWAWFSHLLAFLWICPLPCAARTQTSVPENWVVPSDHYIWSVL